MTTPASVPSVGRARSPGDLAPPADRAEVADKAIAGADPIARPDAVHPFAWRGSPWSLAPLCLMNAALTLLTVGVYNFWGRTEVRRRMWSSVRFLGEPLAYHGTARELMRGFLTVFAVLVVPIFLTGLIVVLLFGQASGTFGVYQIGLFAIVYPILTAIAFYRARRYRLSRTSWRGIRASMDGSSGEYGLISWALALAYPFTLAWIAPYRAVVLQRMLVTDTQLGSEPLRFEGSARPLYWRYALLWFGTLVLLFLVLAGIGTAIGPNFNPQNPLSWARLNGRNLAILVGPVVGAIFVWSIMSSFYYAGLYNHLAQSTYLGRDGSLGLATHRFDLDVRGRHLIWLFVTNSLITYLSLYILRPVATARSIKYYAEHLRLVGPFEPARLGQNLAATDTTGEGLAQAFDLDAF
jgi:uncharacterized membrane protein YjgN (DUF898 family)